MPSDRVQNTKDQIEDEEVLKIYAINNTAYCVWCWVCPASSIHEIIPRSQRPTDWWLLENRAPLCVHCHEKAHHMGSGNAAEEIRQRRDLFVINFGIRAIL